MHYRVVVIAIASLFACAVGCKKETKEAQAEPAAAAAAPASPQAQARKTFRTVCASCHGNSGKGDGPGAAALNPKPRDYTNSEWQASVTDDQLKQIILQGGAAVGKSASMPAQPQRRRALCAGVAHQLRGVPVADGLGPRASLQRDRRRDRRRHRQGRSQPRPAGAAPWRQTAADSMASVRVRQCSGHQSPPALPVRQGI